MVDIGTFLTYTPSHIHTYPPIPSPLPPHTMQRHHFTQTLCILNTKGCNVFEHFSPANYKATLDQMQHIILATDIANHLRHMKQITEMSESETFRLQIIEIS